MVLCHLHTDISVLTNLYCCLLYVLNWSNKPCDLNILTWSGVECLIVYLTGNSIHVLSHSEKNPYSGFNHDFHGPVFHKISKFIFYDYICIKATILILYAIFFYPEVHFFFWFTKKLKYFRHCACVPVEEVDPTIPFLFATFF